MNHDEFERFLQQLGQRRPVQASEAIEDAIELQVQDTLLCLEWNGAQQRLEITMPLTEFVGAGDPDALPLHLRLCRALLAWQWVEAAQPHLLRFGEFGPHGQIVGMASVQAEHIRSAEALETAVLQAHDGLRAAWLQLGTQVLSEALAESQPAPAGAGRPPR